VADAHQLAAERFVCYWESRRALLGPDKYHLRMTLSEAFCDDVFALMSRCLTLLPYPDAFGRPIVYLEPSRNTGDGYSQKSLVSVNLLCL
jgi:hypothetical protein